MAVDTAITSDVLRAQPSERDLQRAKVKELAQQFEAMLLSQMTRSMRQALLPDEERNHDGFGAQTMTDTFDSELGLSLSRAGGIGLSDFIVRAFDRHSPASTSSAN